MRAFLQRVRKASVTIETPSYFSSIQKGYLVLLGVAEEDTEKEAEYLAQKTIGLRVFEDKEGKMNLSIQDIQGEILSVSQFTLYADTKKGNRPGFSRAAEPEKAKKLYEQYNNFLRKELGDSKVQTGIFAANMLVSLENDGPVSILLDSNKIL
ncbi:MAG: D-tyrosyl-tRNA(Tyr) deacylase [Leptospiraceae bacterium]|nr:D-tyrosyl-tRNA(Tyr) deacylase [Leptospiraceae bacterium]